MNENKDEEKNTETQVESKVESTPKANPTKATEVPKNEAKTAEPKKKKHKGFIISIIVIILAVIIGAISAVIYCFFFASTTIDLSKYISIDFEGYEGFASVDEYDVVIDEKGIKKAVDDSKIAKKLISKIEDSIEVEENSELSNGDSVTVKVDIKESFLKNNKLKLKSDEIEITVKDLEETKDIDLFEDLKFNISGISPSLSLSITNNSTDTYIRRVSYKMEIDDKSSSYSLSKLKNGDVVTITADISNANFEKAGYTASITVYEYKIENQPAYITEKSEFSDTILESLKSEFSKKIKKSADASATSAVKSIADNIAYSDKFTASEPEFVKAYLLTSKNSSTNNKVYVIYKVTFTSTADSTTYDYYYTGYVNDVAYDEDGLYTGNSYYYAVSSEYGSSSFAKSSDDAYNYFIETQKSNFDIDEIK